MVSPELADSANWARRYDQISDPQFEHGRDLIDLLGLQPGDRVLDIGCGTGRLAALALQRVHPCGQIVGLDPAAGRIELARTLHTPQIDFRVGRAEKLAFEPATFDAVYLNSSLTWVKDKPRALAEIHRVLKPEGKLGIATTVRDRRNELGRLVQQAYEVVRFGARRTADGPAERGISIDDVRGLLRSARFANHVFELRTYISSFEDAGKALEFLEASTFGAAFHGATGSMEALRTVLEQLIVEELPHERRENGIQLERYMLLAVAERLE